MNVTYSFKNCLQDKMQYFWNLKTLWKKLLKSNLRKLLLIKSNISMQWYKLCKMKTLKGKIFSIPRSAAKWRCKSLWKILKEQFVYKRKKEFSSCHRWAAWSLPRQTQMSSSPVRVKDVDNKYKTQNLWIEFMVWFKLAKSKKSEVQTDSPSLSSQLQFVKTKPIDCNPHKHTSLSKQHHKYF